MDSASVSSVTTPSELAPTDTRALLDVRERLWQGRSAVLVGSGFSRAGSVPLGPSVPPIPIWLELAAAMRQALYGAEAGASPEPLRLAQEFEAAFHRPRLHELIASLINNEQHEPGPLHEVLLRLPWADVFTTNYDTLLERAAQRVPTRYDLVYVPEDLPVTRAPRIVKLHGSLPSYLPLVVTEEDFRTYAHDRAPFAALVQAALVEHAFLLIGFSYDDPNFLRWSGWVRDHLGKHAPSIYLAGWLNLPAHRRQLLEQRGVLPIDLSPVLPENEWIDEDERHQVAMTWLLNTLSNGAPPDPLDWPGEGDKDQRRDNLPLPTSVRPAIPPSGRPKPAPTSPRPGAYRVDNPPPQPDLVQQWRAWRLERETYPGWIVAPTSVMLAAESTIYWWRDDILAGVKDLAPAESLRLLREYAWRHRVACLGLASDEVELVEDALTRVNPAPARLSLPEAAAFPPGVLPEGVSWTEVRHDWAALALHVLQFARHNMDRDRFDRWSLQLEVAAVDPEDVARLHYERCRFALAELDRPRALAQVEAWPEGSGAFPMGDTWRATIWAELGRWDLAERSARASLNRIYLAQATSPKVDVALLSAQGWTRQLLAHAERAHTSEPKGRARR